MALPMFLVVLSIGYLFGGLVSVITNLSDYIRLWNLLALKAKTGLSIVERTEISSQVYSRVRYFSIGFIILINIVAWPFFELNISEETNYGR